MRKFVYILIAFVQVILFSFSLVNSFTAESSDIDVKSTTTGIQGSLLNNNNNLLARFLLTPFQPGSLATAPSLGANVGYFELYDVCYPFDVCGFFSGQILFCDQGTWKDPDTRYEWCVAENCEFSWMKGVSQGTQCCGDDETADNSYYANASSTTEKNVLCQRCVRGTLETNNTLIGNGVLVDFPSYTNRTCYYGDITCNLNEFSNGSYANVYGWGQIINQSCFYGDASCQDNSFSNATKCDLACPNEWEWCCYNESIFADQVTCNETEGCQEIFYDRDLLEAYCTEGNRNCNNYTWFSSVSKCCGDDLTSDNFEATGQNNDCCFNGTVISHNSSLEYMFCYNGELYDCNNFVSLGFETDVAHCGEADDSGWYCDANKNPEYWQYGIPLGCFGCDYNNECYSSYCDAEDGTSEPRYGLVIDTHECFTCLECIGSPGNVVCSSTQPTRCQYDCSGNEECDDVEPMNCRLDTDIYCDSGCISYDRDAGQEYCTTDNGDCQPLTWIKGGELQSFGEYTSGTEIKCCGDDLNEFHRTSNFEGVDYSVCCNNDTDCVNDLTMCIDSGDVYKEYSCVNGFWNTLPTIEGANIHKHVKLEDSLVGYWTLDNDVKDYSSNNNDGTNYGAINSREGYASGAFDFDGVNDYIGNIALENMIEYSAGAWIKWDGKLTDRNSILAGRTSSTGYFSLLAILTPNGELYSYRSSPDSSLISSFIVPINEWVHVVTVQDSTYHILYANGEEVGRREGNVPYSALEFVIGKGYSGRFFSGLIDEVMIFDRALSSEEIMEIYNKTAYTKNDLTCAPINPEDADGDEMNYVYNWYKDDSSIMVLNMPFDNNVSSVSQNAIRDYTIYENNGTLGGGNPSYAPKYKNNNDCISGGCYDFDGNDYITVADDNSLDLTEIVTIETWVKPFNVAGSNTIISKSGSTTLDTTFWLEIRNSNDLFFGGYTPSGGVAYLLTTFNFNNNEWYQIVGIDDGSNLLLYVNSELVGMTTSKSRKSGTWPLKIGIRGTYGNHFKGIIDEVKIYNVALTPEQVYANYIAGLNKHQPDVLDYSLTQKHEEWNCDIIVNDGYGDSNRVTSEKITIKNTPPEKPVLLQPENNSITTNRHPTFIWQESLDDDNDIVTYDLEVLFKVCNILNQEYCTGTNLIKTGITGSEYQDLVTELDIADYEWQVTPRDDEEHGEPSGTFTFEIEALLNISLVNDVIQFPQMTLGSTEDTSDNNPLPFIIENNGNTKVDISINSTNPFQAVALNTEYFQTKARQMTQGSIDTTASELNWINLSESLKKIIYDLKYLDSLKQAYIDIKIKVPEDEPPGEKSSTIIVSGEIS